MSTALLLALVVAQPSQDADVRVSYKTVAVPLARALDELSKASGVKLKAAPQLENEIVVISVKNAPLSEVKSKLAKAAVGVWTRMDDGTEMLGVDGATRATLSRTALAKEAEELSKDLKQLQEVLSPQKQKGSENPGIFGVGDASTKLMARLSLGLRATDLAAMAQDDRIVYSTEPNSMQRRLNVVGLAKAVADFVVEHNLQFAKSKNSDDQLDPAMQLQVEQAKSIFGDYIKTPARIDTAPAKILLVVEHGGPMGFMGGSFQLSFIAFDAKGVAVASSNYPLGGSPMRSVAGADGERTVAAQETTQSEKTTAPAKQPDKRLEKAIELSAESKELKSLTNFMDPSRGKKASPELMAKMMRPDLYDPLSFQVSDSLLQLAEARSDNLVAFMPDTEMDLRSFMGQGDPQTLAAFEAGISGNPQLVIERDGGWETLRAADPDSEKLRRVDRKSLARFLASVQATSVPSLDALSAYATLNPPIMETPVIMPHIMLAAPNAMSLGMRGLQDWKMLRLWGLLGGPERDALRQGKALPFSSVAPKAQALVKQMVYGAGQKLQVGPDKDSPFGMFGGVAMMGLGPNLSSFKEEPTELLPTGLPASGTIGLNLKPSHFVLSADGAGGIVAMFGAMGPEEYAMLKYFCEEPKMAAASAMMPKLDKMKVGERDVLDFHFLLAPDVTQRHTLMDHRISKDASVVGPDGLPKDFMADVDKQLKLFKDGLSPFLAMPGGPGSAVPPAR